MPRHRIPGTLDATERFATLPCRRQDLTGPLTHDGTTYCEESTEPVAAQRDDGERLETLLGRFLGFDPQGENKNQAAGQVNRFAANWIVIGDRLVAALRSPRGRDGVTRKLEWLANEMVQLLEQGMFAPANPTAVRRLLSNFQRMLNRFPRSKQSNEIAEQLERLESAIEPWVDLRVLEVNPRYVRNVLLRERFGRFRNAKRDVRRNMDVIAEFVLRHGMDANDRNRCKLQEVAQLFFDAEYDMPQAFEIVDLKIGDRIWERTARRLGVRVRAGNSLEVGEWFSLAELPTDEDKKANPVSENRDSRQFQLTTDTCVLRSFKTGTDNWWGKAQGNFRSNAQLLSERHLPQPSGADANNFYWLPNACRVLRYSF